MHIVVPVKSFHLAKSRLAPALSSARRARLARAMLMGVLKAASSVSGVSGVSVVSRQRPDFLDMLPSAVDWIAECPLSHGLNAALTGAAQQLHAQRVRRILILPSDLPCLQPVDVEAIVDCAERILAASACATLLVPDHRLQGTNALAINLPLPFDLSYGPYSFNRHSLAARLAGCKVHTMQNRATEADLDEPCDLHRLRARPTSAFSTPILHTLLATWAGGHHHLLEADGPGWQA